MDVDSAGLINLKLLGKPVDPKSPADIKEIVASTRLPFLVKGIMTPRAALICRDAGAAGIVVSSHGGRVLEDAPATCSVLPEIRGLWGQVSRSLWTAAYAPARTCSRRWLWARTPCSSAGPTLWRLLPAAPRA
jgi:hypothetical protein